jgi:hypothetical protein
MASSAATASAGQVDGGLLGALQLFSVEVDGGDDGDGLLANDALGLEELPADIGVLLHPVTAIVRLRSASIAVRAITASELWRRDSIDGSSHRGCAVHRTDDANLPAPWDQPFKCACR